MDSVLLSSKLFYAENCIRSFTTPTFIPSVFYSIVAGCLAVACYEKFIRKDYFLPYLYFGNTGLLYAVSHIFLIIFVVEEDVPLTSDDEMEVDFSHTYGLYAALIISAFGSYFINLASFRLLENWIRSGQNKDTYFSKYSITVMCMIFSFIPVLFSVSGDIILIIEANKEFNNVTEVEKALVLKVLGAACNIVLSLVFVGLFASYSWSAYINNTIEKAIQKEKNIDNDDYIESSDKEYVEKTFKRVVIMLLSIGLLALIRFTYDLYIVIQVITHGPTWDPVTYLILVVADGILLLATTLTFDLSSVKQLVVYTRMRSALFRHFSRHKDSEEVIPFSRSPMALENADN